MMEVQPPKWQFLNEDEKEELMKHYSGRQLGWCQVGVNKWLMPYAYAEKGEDIWRIKVRPTDRWIVAFPRSGKSTFICSLFEMVNSNINEVTKENKKGPEKSMQESKVRLSTNSLESRPSPRFIKTHMPFEMLPAELLETRCKVVYIARNPKGIVFSLYHVKTSRKNFRYTEDFSSFLNFFLRNLELWCPYWAHVKKAWSLRQHPNLLFLFYEEMKMDMPSIIRKVAETYGRPCTDDDVAKLARHLDFDNFKNNPMIGPRKIDGQDVFSRNMFVRKGQVGGWRELFTPELEAQADKWIEENLRVVWDNDHRRRM